MHIVIVTDAWFPQVNGVVRSLSTVIKELRAMGEKITVISPDMFRSVSLPGNNEIQLSVFPRLKMARMLDELNPDAIHIPVEGPLGYAARRWALSRGLPYTTAYHTKFPEYAKARFGVPELISYKVIRRFHKFSSAIMVATQSLEDDLRARGFKNIVRWSRGVDMNLFHPSIDGKKDFYPKTMKRPIWLNVGRVSVEKNLEAFLDLDLPGSKVIVGGGPKLDSYKAEYPAVYFAGEQKGEALSKHYAGADVFVFPSVSDTFGLVLLEALACGVPVAAYPVTGPRDVLTSPLAACLNTDLKTAALGALTLSPADCLAFAQTYSWRASAEQFLRNLKPVPDSVKALAA